MRKLIALSLLALPMFAAAQSNFPLGGSFIYQPKTRDTIAAVETPVGILPVQFGVKSVNLTAIVYAGVDTTASAGAAGFGLRLDKSAGPALSYHVGGVYGTAVKQSPHFGLEIGVSVALQPLPKTAQTHEYVIQ